MPADVRVLPGSRQRSQDAAGGGRYLGDLDVLMEARRERRTWVGRDTLLDFWLKLYLRRSCARPGIRTWNLPGPVSALYSVARARANESSATRRSRRKGLPIAPRSGPIGNPLHILLCPASLWRGSRTALARRVGKGCWIAAWSAGKRDAAAARPRPDIAGRSECPSMAPTPTTEGL